MKTPWTDLVDFDAPLQEYPRPQMARKDYFMLNGVWDYAITRCENIPDEFDGHIIVPFSPESYLSGVNQPIKNREYIWYHKNVELPLSYRNKRILLHFDAADREALVWVNGKKVANHFGGYLPFTIDITDVVAEDTADIFVRVNDNTEKGYGTRGKQKRSKGGIWYSSQSGLWQSVWIEPVPDVYIKSLKITPQYDLGTVAIDAVVSSPSDAYVVFNKVKYKIPAIVPVKDFESWSPENPKLYGFSVFCGKDCVQSYFAMRKLSVVKDEDGIARLFLNNRPYKFNGILDQGYWPDGIYTAPTDEALVYDIRVAKAMGFNTIRKHVKIEPIRWYYHCDRIGMIVWQDIPNGGGSYSKIITQLPLISDISIPDKYHFLFGRSNKSGRDDFTKETMAIIGVLYNCPCIAMWIPFNEGWGQFDSATLCSLIRKADATRFIDHASGWHDQKIGNIRSIHNYYKKFTYKPDKLGRATILSEFGGYGHKVINHCYSKKYYSYKKFEMPAQYQLALEDLYNDTVKSAYSLGMSGSIYTQLTDIEDELDGLVTYDRKVVKIAPQVMKEIINFNS